MFSNPLKSSSNTIPEKNKKHETNKNPQQIQLVRKTNQTNLWHIHLIFAKDTTLPSPSSATPAAHQRKPLSEYDPELPAVSLITLLAGLSRHKTPGSHSLTLTPLIDPLAM